MDSTDPAYTAYSGRISLCICVYLSDAGITILLALSVYQMIVNEKLPSTSDAVPLLGKAITIYR